MLRINMRRFPSKPIEYFSLEEIKELFIEYKNTFCSETNAIEICNHIIYYPLLDEDNLEKIDRDLPKKHCDIRLIRISHTDSTLYFRTALILEAFSDLIYKTINHIDTPDKIPDIYKIGKMRFEIEDSDETHPDGWKFSEKISLCIPIKFIYEKTI
jgi:hypothetical protein